MRWLLQWLVEDILRLFGVPVTEHAELREEMVRRRQRKGYHSAELTEAEERLTVHRRRVRVMERSPDTPREDLVAARRELVQAEGDVRHHEARLHQARVELEEMQASRHGDPADGEDPS